MNRSAGSSVGTVVPTPGSPARVVVDARPAPARLLWADLARGLAICGVVLVHAAAQALLPPRGVSARADWWWAGNLYDSLARPAVPLFVMLSGALLLDPSRETTAFRFLRRRLPRLLIPLLLWSLVYMAWNYRYNGYHVTDPVGAAKAILAGPVAVHLWYLYMLLALYLVAPVLQPYIRAASVRNQLYLGALWFAANSIVPVLQRPSINLPIGAPFEGVTLFIGYFVLGRTLATAVPSVRSRALVPLAAAVWLASFAITVVGTYALTSAQGVRLNEDLYGYQSPNVVLMGLSLYVLLVRAGTALRRLDPNLGRVISGFGQLALGIYLLHPLVLEVLSRNLFGWGLRGISWFHPCVAIPATAAVVLGISAVVVALTRRLPVVKWLVG